MPSRFAARRRPGRDCRRRRRRRRAPRSASSSCGSRLAAPRSLKRRLAAGTRPSPRADAPPFERQSGVCARAGANASPQPHTPAVGSLCHPTLNSCGKKQVFTGGTAPIYRAPLPHGDFQPQGSFVVNYRRWRSLELHKHHSALGLATALRVRFSRSRSFARTPPARRPLLRREVSGPVALCGQGESLARAAPDPVGQRRHALRRGLDRRGAPGRRTLPEAACASCTRSRPRKRSPRPISTHGVRTFSLDTHRGAGEDPRAPPDGATDLNLCVRLRVSSEHSKLQPRRPSSASSRTR